MPSVAIYSECDRTAPNVRHAYEAVAIGPSPAAESYLDVERVLAAAAETDATAVHPGYGFLAENVGFARTCRAAGLVFIGPDAGVIETMGGKTAARPAAIDAGVPVVPGTEALPDTLSEAELRARADEVGSPLFIKAGRRRRAGDATRRRPRRGRGRGRERAVRGGGSRRTLASPALAEAAPTPPASACRAPPSHLRAPMSARSARDARLLRLPSGIPRLFVTVPGTPS